MVTPFRVKPVPLMATCDIVTLDPPEFVRVSNNDELFPTVTLPKPRLVGLAEIAPLEAPVAESGILNDGLDALDVTVTLPVALLAEVGVNTTWKVVFCPAPSVTGVVTPLKVNPVPVTPICEIVTLLPPVFVTVSRSDELFPTVTVPKLRVVGLEARSPAVTPVPESGIFSEGFDALDVTTTLPLPLPAVVGVNTTWKVVFCPAPNVTGVVTPLKVNPVPLAAICEIVTVVPPVFVTVSRSDELLPTVTLPKLRLEGFEVRTPTETPLAESGMPSDGLDAFDVTVTLPVAAPAAVGLNTTWKVVLCPAPTVMGVVTPFKLNPVPLMVT